MESSEGRSAPAESTEKQAEAESAPRVFLIRHADASDGDKDADVGRPLSEIGMRQAEALARRVAGWQLDAILCSDMRRARETAAYLHRQHPQVELIVDPVFREISAGTVERQLDAPDGALRERLEAAWRRVVTIQHRVAAIVTHNGMIKYLIGRTIGYEAELKPRFHSAHTGITALRIRSKMRAGLQFFNDTRHLDPAIVTPGEKGPWIEDPVTRRWHF